MKENLLAIHPLDLGTMKGIDKSIFTLHQNQGIKIDVPCLSYVIVGGGKNILVDTGPCGAEWAASYHRDLIKEPSQEMPNALGKLGLEPGQIDIIVLTHLHWDHCFNLEYFPDATIVVQQRELKYAIAPLPADCVAYEAGIPDVQPPWMHIYGRIMGVDGDVELIPGVEVILIPGHTPGFQGVKVETGKGQWVIAGDTVPIYENWEKEGDAPITPGGIYQDLFSYYRTLEKLKSFGNRLLPGHDERVLKQTQYPSLQKASL